jgi:hypothetical protein
MHEVKHLSERLLEAYSEGNLNKIARNLIRLYKEKEFEKLNIISGLISEWVEIEIEPAGKGFSKIISLYHPDRCEYYRSQIAELTNRSDLSTLVRFEHIFVIQNIEEIAASIESCEDIDYHPEYQWDVGKSGFSYFHESRKKPRTRCGKAKCAGYSFYDAVKIRQYGDMDTEFPTYYLEEMDELELAESEIDDLDGVEYCIHTLILDLSYNLIYDLSPLTNLCSLLDLNLSNNRIEYIDEIGNLRQLKSINLSNNSINDISPLFDICSLEFADLTGNKIPMDQIRVLREMGVTVEY